MSSDSPLKGGINNTDIKNRNGFINDSMVKLNIQEQVVSERLCKTPQPE